MEKAVKELEEKAPQSAYLANAKINLAILKEDWTSASAAVNVLSAEPINGMTILRLSHRATTQPDAVFPAEMNKVILAKFDEIICQNKRIKENPLMLVTQSSLQWLSDEKDAALASAAKATELAAQPREDGRNLPLEPFKNFHASLKEGKLVGSEEFLGSLRKVSAAAEKAKTPATE